MRRSVDHLWDSQQSCGDPIDLVPGCFLRVRVRPEPYRRTRQMTLSDEIQSMIVAAQRSFPAVAQCSLLYKNTDFTGGMMEAQCQATSSYRQAPTPAQA